MSTPETTPAPQLRLLPFRQVLDASVAPARQALPAVFLPVAVPVAACTVVVSLISNRVLATMGLLDGDSPADLGVLLGSSGVMISLVTVLLAVYSLAYTALTVAALDTLSGRAPDIGRAWLFALRPSVMMTVAIVVVLTVLSVIMCLLPVLITGPLLSFVTPVMVFERRFGFAALRRSVALVRFNPRRRLRESPFVQVLVVLFVSWVIGEALSALAQGPFLIAQQVWLARQAAQGVSGAELIAATPEWLTVASSIAGSMALVLGWMYGSFTLVRLFFEVRRRAEGDDLERAIDSMVEGEVASEPA